MHAMTLTPDQIDALILDAASDHFTKIAVIIAKVFDAFEAQGAELSKDLSHQIAGRIYTLIDNGALACQGNMRRWREADVKLPEKA
jgi:hypothetical protein